MKKHPDFYTEEEKEIFINYFILENNSSKTNFRKYYEKFLLDYGHAEIVDTIPDIKLENELYIKHRNVITKYSYSTSHVKWGNENNDNLITFIASQPNFIISNTKMKALNSLHPDWKHVNNEGNTILHLLAKKGGLYSLKKIIDDIPELLNKKNNNHDYFTFILLDPNNFKTNGLSYLDFIRKILVRIDNLVELYINLNHHFEDTSLDKIEMLKNNFEDIKNKMKNYIEKENFNQQHNIQEITKEAIDKMDTFLSYHLLEKNVKNKDIKIGTRTKI